MRARWLFRPQYSPEQLAHLPEEATVTRVLGDPFHWQPQVCGAAELWGGDQAGWWQTGWLGATVVVACSGCCWQGRDVRSCWPAYSQTHMPAVMVLPPGYFRTSCPATARWSMG